jgi:hypothetical protein
MPDLALRSVRVGAGLVTYRWLEGGRFLIQNVDLGQYGERITGIEVIGRERPFGSEEPSVDIKSRFYGSSGDTLDYVYALEDDLLTIWFGEKGSPAYFLCRHRRRRAVRLLTDSVNHLYPLVSGLLVDLCGSRWRAVCR